MRLSKTKKIGQFAFLQATTDKVNLQENNVV